MAYINSPVIAKLFPPLKYFYATTSFQQQMPPVLKCFNFFETHEILERIMFLKYDQTFLIFDSYVLINSEHTNLLDEEKPKSVYDDVKAINDGSIAAVPFADNIHVRGAQSSQ